MTKPTVSGNPSVPKPLVIYGGPLFDGEARVWPDGCIYVVNGRIEAFGSEESVFAVIPRTAQLDYNDTDGALIAPGLVDLHRHSGLTLARGLWHRPANTGQPALSRRIARALNEELIQLSALADYMEAVRAGTTVVFDLHSSPLQQKNSLSVLAGAAERIGLRAVLGYATADADGADELNRAIEENSAFIENHAEHPSIRGMFGLAHPRLLSDAGLTTVRDRIDPPLPVCSCGGRIGRLRDNDLLSDRTLLVHAGKITPAEAAWLSSSGAVVAETPRSLSHWADSAAIPAVEPDRPTGLGSDSASPGLGLALRDLWFRDKAHFSSRAVSMLSTNNRLAARLLGGSPGMLKKGQTADLVVFDYAPLTPVTEETLWEHLALGLCSASARLVLAAGRPIFQDGGFVGVDETLIREECRQAAARLWAQLEI